MIHKAHVFFFMVLGCFLSPSKAFPLADGKHHIQTALRMIGHQILLDAGDTTSLVLPIVEQEDQAFQIAFENEFQLYPNRIVERIISVAHATDLGEHFIVQVQQCATKEIVYAFEVNASEELEIIPCRSRTYPVDCYTLLFQFDQQKEASAKSSQRYWWLCLSLIPLVALFYLLRKRQPTSTTTHLMTLGKYSFNTRTSILKMNDLEIPLSGKEASLLLLLYRHVNETVSREVILKEVWEDDGDYVGRTLDVFISKLRKKLEGDPQIQIINIRGIGYKLVMEQ